MDFKKIYDLTHPLYHNCPGWPDFPPPTVERLMYIPQHMANVEMLHINTHTGTHIDVPYHFFPEGDTLEKVPVERFIGEGVVVDISHKGDKEAVTAADLDKIAGHVKKDDIVMLYTGRGKDRGFNQRYLKDWPSVDESGAKWFVQKGVKLLGTDGLGIEMYGFQKPVVHKALLGAGIIIAEEVYLEDVAKLGTRRLTYLCLPLVLKGAGGCLSRIIAFEE